MKIHRLTTALTLVNLALLLGIVASQVRSAAAAQDVVPMLRGRGLEIVDAQGRVRASIALQPPSRVGRTDHPTGVILRLVNSRGAPVVKLGASENGSGLNLSDGSPAFSGVQILAIDTGSIVRVRNPDGTEKMIKP